MSVHALGLTDWIEALHKARRLNDEQRRQLLKRARNVRTVAQARSVSIVIDATDADITERVRGVSTKDLEERWNQYTAGRVSSASIMLASHRSAPAIEGSS